MSCATEPQLLLYAEGELEGTERREVESHLVTCRDCRARVVALRDEELLLRDTLGERVREPRPEPVHTVAPEPTGIAWGLPIAVAFVAAIFSAAGFLLENRMPGSLDLFNPLRLKGAIEMSFDLIFMLRESAPGLIELAISIGVVASISAVLSLGTNVLYRRIFGTAALLLALIPVPSAEAVVVRIEQEEREIRIAANEVVEESMVLSGDIVHIDGVVRGDVFVGAERVTIGGTVEGSLYTFARDLEITGKVTGSTHGMVEHMRIDGVIEGNLYAVSESVTLAPDASIERDFISWAEDGTLSGKVGRDVLFGGEDLELRGEVGRNVEVRFAERVALRDAARLGGNLLVTIEDEADLDQAAGAQIAGETTVREPEHMKRHLAWYRNPALWALHGVLLVAAFFFGLLLHVLAPRLFVFELQTSRQFFENLGIGFLALVATPVAIVLMALTLVGIPIAVLTLFVFLVGIYTANILIGAWIGKRLLPPREGSLSSFARSFFVGLLLVTLLTHIPFIGAPIEVIVALVGVGLIVNQGRQRIAAMV
jgi:cytoskeletal protein CcmA (bactofilin family)